MSDSLVRIHVSPPGASIILNRPEKRNALTRAMIAELSQALDDLHQERRVRAVILTGAGPAFCAGMDLGEMLETSRQDDALAQWHRDAVMYLDLILVMLRFPKPLIAAVNGPAMAGGAGLVLACDLVVAAESAAFGLPEPLRGIVAGMVAPLLHFRVGGGQAARLLLSASTLPAAEALRIGLFHEIVHPDHLWPRASELAAQCARCAPEALQLSKRLLNETIGEQLTTLLTAGAAASATARTTEAAAEGLAAFLEKRDPIWP
ncbi:MAG TPA: enoyl-CoA hydratase/isomerase family protein [Pirellulales bacterium]|jgi:enoyl-CoA hydratase/carnithine racemase|nr:enoyl-CoA hydratase/isomerase family protein [Pirellulales bacterium]